MPETKLPIEPLTPERFAPFGQAILKPGAAPTSSGDGWDCWFDVGRLAGGDLRIGQVVTRRNNAPVAVMERHPDEEFLLPVDGLLIQVVAPAGDLCDPTERPDASAAVAFRLEPGEAVVVAPSVWHAAALPVDEAALYFFTGLTHPPEPGHEDSPWVAFRDGVVLRVEV
ncbi:MAG: ureidoglycolate lyase [Alphaproteobacteria bacterium]